MMKDNNIMGNYMIKVLFVCHGNICRSPMAQYIFQNMIDKDVVIDLIGYYIGIFHRIKEYHSDITDYNEERYWKYYLKFVRSIPDNFYG